MSGWELTGTTGTITSDSVYTPSLETASGAIALARPCPDLPTGNVEVTADKAPPPTGTEIGRVAQGPLRTVEREQAEDHQSD